MCCIVKCTDPELFPSLNLCNEFSVTLCLSYTKSKIIPSNGLLNFLHSSMIRFSLSMNNLSVQNPWSHLLTFQCLWFHCSFVQQKNLYNVWTIFHLLLPHLHYFSFAECPSSRVHRYCSSSLIHMHMKQYIFKFILSLYSVTFHSSNCSQLLFLGKLTICMTTFKLVSLTLLLL